MRLESSSPQRVHILPVSLIYRDGQYFQILVTFCEDKGTTRVNWVCKIPEVIVSILPLKGELLHEEKLQQIQEHMDWLGGQDIYHDL